ncbi:hypothetical protein H9Q69_002990 [Fusarium xylarioides]|nr:hypothetical protein H9Q69_002990 [Fusarium xylarioides]
MAQTDELVEFEFTEIDDKEFQLHLQHHGVEQPNNITGQDQLRSKGVVICGRLVEAVHGRMNVGESPQKQPCTLAIFEWYIHTSQPGQRIKFARIDMTFKSLESNRPGTDPWVADCAPWGSYSLFETKKTLEATKNWQPGVKIGQESVANAELSYVYGMTETVERGDQIFIDGFPLTPKDGVYSHPDRLSAVQWNVFENESQESGIPRYFRTAVLLDRSESKGSKFNAVVEIKTKVSTFEDMREKVNGFLGRKVKDDPLVFNPALDPKTDVFKDKIDDLGSHGVNLEEEMGFLLFRNRDK